MKSEEKKQQQELEDSHLIFSKFHSPVFTQRHCHWFHWCKTSTNILDRNTHIWNSQTLLYCWSFNLLVHSNFTDKLLQTIIGTFRSDYDNDYEYEFFNVYSVRMRDCVRLSRQLVLSSKSRCHPDANYEIFDKSCPPTTSSLQEQRQVKRLVFKGADTLWNVPCNLSRNVLATLWHLVLFVC